MKLNGIILLCLLCGCFYARDVELAIVREPKDPEFSEAKFRRWIRFFPKNVLFIDADSLSRPETLANIKRIVIPAAPRIFSAKMLDGMIKYAADGGLIITESIMNGIDHNGDFKEDFSLLRPYGKRKKGHPRPGDWPPTGVCAHASCKINAIEAVIECPLSTGFPVGKPVNIRFSFRNVIRADGNVIFTASAVSGGGKKKVIPLVVLRNAGKGTFVFLPFQIERLVKNALSPKTLDWLTDQE